jgi:hypothetical protein
MYYMNPISEMLHSSISEVIYNWLSRHKTPQSFQSWREAVIPRFLYLQGGNPTPPNADTLQKWVRSYDKWRMAYEGFLEIDQHLNSLSRLEDETDQRHREFYAAVLLQSGQWHVILLLMLKDIPEAERGERRTEIDRLLTDLRKRIAQL